MKTPTLLALILLIASPAYGQTTDYVPYFTDSSGTLGNSVMYQSGSNIGIDTTSPAYPLEVGAGSGQVIARINGGSSGAAGGGVLYFGNGGTTTSAIGGLSAITGGAFNSDLAIYGASTTNNKLHFYAGSSESMTLTSNSVGIATTSPANTLDIGNSGGIHITSGVPSSTSNALYNNSGTLTWNGSALATTTPSSIILSAGQLQCSGGNCSNSTGSGTIQYCPYKGNIKTTASQGTYTIPSACLTATLTSMYVGGTGSSSVSASTLYYIYLWNTSGTWVLDAETTGHATDSSTGIEIKSGDGSKTLVGMIHTDASKHVMTGGLTHVGGDTNTVATWDNRIATSTTCAFTADRQVTPTSLTEVNSENRCLFMSWGDAAQLSSRQMLYPLAGASFYATTVIAINGTTPYESYNYEFLNVNTGTAPYSLAVLPASFKPPEGYNYTELLALTGVGDTITYPYSSGVAITNVFTIQ